MWGTGTMGSLVSMFLENYSVGVDHEESMFDW